jgi:dihydrofolate reductase
MDIKFSVFIAASLDGFIARPNGDIDWLMAANDPGDSEDYGYGEFMNSVGCMVMGRNSFEKVLEFGEWPYEGKRVIVLSSTLTGVPAEAEGKVELCNGSIKDLAEQLKNEGIARVYLDGGVTIQSFLKEGLVSDLTITRVPVLIGSGLPLFGALEDDVALEHRATNAYPSGFVTSLYEVR